MAFTTAFPFHYQTHEMLWEEVEVEEASLLDFSALAEYGGWGIRYIFFSKPKLSFPEAAPACFLKCATAANACSAFSNQSRFGS